MGKNNAESNDSCPVDLWVLLTKLHRTISSRLTDNFKQAFRGKLQDLIAYKRSATRSHDSSQSLTRLHNVLSTEVIASRHSGIASEIT